MHLARYISSLELHVRWDGVQWTAVLLDHARRTAYAQASLEGGAAVVAAVETQVGAGLTWEAPYRAVLAQMRLALAEQDTDVPQHTSKDTAYGQHEES